MAIELVGVAEGSAANGGDATITLPTCLENDVVVVAGGVASNATIATDLGPSTSGYTDITADLEHNQSGISYVKGSWAYKRMGVSPDTTVTCVGDGAATHACAYVVMVFRGVDTTTAIDATATTVQATGVPNAPSITTATDGAAILAMAVSTGGDSAVGTISGYGDQVDVVGDDTVDVTAGAAWLLKASAGAENPGAWSTWGSSVYVAATIAPRPSTAGTIATGVLSSTGTATASFEDGTEKVLGITASITAEFIGAPFVSASWSMAGTAAADWVGSSTVTGDSPFSMAGTGTALFVGGLANAASIGATGTWTVAFSGASMADILVDMGGSVTVMFAASNPRSFISHIKEVVESKGAASVRIG